MAAIAVMETRIYLFPTILKTRKLKPLKGRMSLESFYNHSTLLNDRLRANLPRSKLGLKQCDLSKYTKEHNCRRM